MPRIQSSPLLTLLVLTASSTHLLAQSAWTPKARLVDSYPRTIGLTVAVDPDATGGALVYDGAGGDVFLLRHDPALGPPVELYDVGNGPHVLDTGGVAMDIALADDFTYVAAFRNGIQVFRRPEDLPVCAAAAPCWPAPVGHDVLSVSAVDVPIPAGPAGTVRVLAVGTERRDLAPTEGALFLLVHDPLGGLQEIGAWNVGAPVYAVAASTAFPYRATQLGTNLTVLLGTGCGRAGGRPSPLQRRDFIVLPGPAGTLTARQILRQGWTRVGTGGPQDMVIRDIVIDPDIARAYVAAQWDGVWAFDLHPSLQCPDPNDPARVLRGLCPDPSPGWPLQLPNGLAWSCPGSSPTVLGYARCLALAVDSSAGGGAGAERRLFVGLGPSRSQTFNIQFLGNTLAPPCNAGQEPPAFQACGEVPVEGVFSWHLDGAGDPIAGGGGTFAPDAWIEAGLSPRALAPRQDPVDPGLWYVYVSDGVRGLSVLEERMSAGPPGLSRVGDWNGGAPAKMPMPAFDDVLAMSTTGPAGNPVDALFAAYETGLAVFDLADPEPLRLPSTGQNAKNPTAPFRVNKGAILLAGFENPNGRIFAGTTRGRPKTPGGIRFYDVSDPLRPAVIGDLELHREGFGYGLAAQPGLYDPASPPPPNDRRRYLYSVQELKPVAGVAVEQWSVRLWDVGTANAPIDPCFPNGSTAQTPCNTCVPCVASFANKKSAERELSGLAVLEQTPNQQVVYTLYSPRPQIPGEPSPPSGSLGVVALEARRGPAGKISLRPVKGSSPPFEPDGYFEALAGPVTSDFRATLVSVDPANSRLYAAWTGAIAMYDVSVPIRPVLLGARWTGLGDYGLSRSAVRMVRGPSVGGRDYVYIAFMNDGVGILDATDGASFGTAPIDYHPMRWQTTLVAPDPRDPSLARIFVGSGTGGLDAVFFQ